MKITGRLGDYDCQYVDVGRIYAECVVRTFAPVTRRRWFGLLPSVTEVVYTPVWQSVGPKTSYGGTIFYSDARKQHPQQLRNWFERVVQEYEDYTMAWNKELDMPATKVVIPQAGPGYR